MAAGSGTLIYIVSGTITGWPSPTLARLTKGKDEPVITEDEGSWIATMPQITMCLSSVPAAYFANTLGRKPVMLLSSIPFILGWLLITFASSVWFLYAARLISGLGLGLAMTTAPMYVIEVAEDRIRGALGTIFMFMMNVGLVFESSVGPYVSRSTLGALSAIFPILFVLTFFWMPESPYYYLLRKRTEDAVKSLMRLRNEKHSDGIKDDLDRMEKFVEESLQNKSNIKDLLNRNNRKALVIMIVFGILQNFTGIPAVLSYSTDIFEQSGISLDASITVILMGVLLTILSVISSLTVDFAGRRPMLLASTAFCSLSLLVEGLHFYLKETLSKDKYGSDFDWVPILGMAVYLAAFSAGVGPIPGMIVSEIVPTHVKGLAISIYQIMTAAFSAVVTKLYQAIASDSGMYAAFWMFAACTAVYFVFVAIMVPETKGKSLMDIHRELSSTESKNKDISSSINILDAHAT